MFRRTFLNGLAVALVVLPCVGAAWGDDISDGDQGGGGGNGAQREYVNENDTVRIEIITPSGNKEVKVVRLAYGLKLSGYIRPNVGLVIQSVDNGPATSMQGNGGGVFALERGDVVEEIDGISLDSKADYFQALSDAAMRPGRQVELAVRDINSGRLNYFTTRLARLQ